jgi:tetratricopeptide (TPR) repeat protein
MGTKGREATQRILAIIVIIAMLGVMGIPPSVIIFFTVITYFIYRAVQRSEHQETGRIFEFFISANDILRDEERRWYGFEIMEVIERGERVLHSMSDPPPLVYYTLGALYNHAGDHQAAVEHLSYVVENDLADERHRLTPSPELSRYVHILRKLEREPSEAPMTMAAIRSLDRARRQRAATLLAESRQRLEAIPALAQAPQPAPSTFIEHVPSQTETPARRTTPAPRRPGAQPPPPISDVLRDVYEEEKKTA